MTHREVLILFVQFIKENDLTASDLLAVFGFTLRELSAREVIPSWVMLDIRRLMVDNLPEGDTSFTG